MADDLHILSAGAVKGLVLAVQPGFEATPASRLHALASARSARCATSSLPARHATSSSPPTRWSGRSPRAARCMPDRALPSVVCRPRSPSAPVRRCRRSTDAESLKSALLGAAALYIPDATRSTAGAHVVARSGQARHRATALAPRLRMFANGAAAMRELAATSDSSRSAAHRRPRSATRRAWRWSGRCRQPFALATVYSAAICAATRDDASAARSSSSCLPDRAAPSRAAPAGSIRLSVSNAAQLSGP